MNLTQHGNDRHILELPAETGGHYWIVFNSNLIWSHGTEIDPNGLPELDNRSLRWVKRDVIWLCQWQLTKQT